MALYSRPLTIFLLEDKVKPLDQQTVEGRLERIRANGRINRAVQLFMLVQAGAYGYWCYGQVCATRRLRL